MRHHGDHGTLGDAFESGVELDGDLPLQQRFWRIQRVGWAGMLLVIMAAAGGMLGRGPMVRSEAATPDGAVRLRFDRIARAGAPQDLRLSFDSAFRSAHETVRLRLDRSFFDRFDLVSAVPLPESERIVDRGVELRFGASLTGPDAELLLRVRSRRPGAACEHIEVVFGDEGLTRRVQMLQFSLP